MLRTIATMLSTTAACVLIFLGWHWQVIGFGLNPIAAWPLAMMFLAAPIAAFWGER